MKRNKLNRDRLPWHSTSPLNQHKLPWWRDGYGIKMWIVLSLAGLAFVTVATLLMMGAAWLDARSTDDWQVFVKEHQCRKVGEKAGQTVVGVGTNMSNGMPVVTVGSTSSQTAWLCNDDVVYWR